MTFSGGFGRPPAGATSYGYDPGNVWTWHPQPMFLLRGASAYRFYPPADVALVLSCNALGTR